MRDQRRVVAVAAREMQVPPFRGQDAKKRTFNEVAVGRLGGTKAIRQKAGIRCLRYSESVLNPCSRTGVQDAGNDRSDTGNKFLSYLTHGHI